MALLSCTLKEDGNIDAARLEKDFRSALDFDMKYKQEDNMKKRACKISADYNEFKAFVACAHLKTVSRTEISSLGSAKKGWRKTAHSDKSSSALILADELRLNRTCDKLNIDHSCPTVKPKTPMELDRDLRKLPTEIEKCRYLSRIGKKRVIKLLQADGNAELLQIIIEILLSVSEVSLFDDTIALKRNPIASEVCNDDSEMSNTVKNCINEKSIGDVEALQWLDALTGLDKFNLMMFFLSKDLIVKITRTLRTSVNMHYHDVADRYNLVR